MFSTSDVHAVLLSTMARDPILVFAFVFDDGGKIPFAVPAHPQEEEIFDAFQRETTRRRKLKKTTHGRIRPATNEELEHWNLAVPRPKPLPIFE